MSIKAEDVPFAEFRRSVLLRGVGRKGRQLLPPECTMDSVYLEKNSEDSEIKMDMRFLSKYVRYLSV